MDSLYDELVMRREAEWCEGQDDARTSDRAVAWSAYVALCASRGETPDEDCERCYTLVDDSNYCEGRYAETLCEDCGESQGL